MSSDHQVSTAELLSDHKKEAGGKHQASGRAARLQRGVVLGLDADDGAEGEGAAGRRLVHCSRVGVERHNGAAGDFVAGPVTLWRGREAEGPTRELRRRQLVLRCLEREAIHVGCDELDVSPSVKDKRDRRPRLLPLHARTQGEGIHSRVTSHAALIILVFPTRKRSSAIARAVSVSPKCHLRASQHSRAIYVSGAYISARVIHPALFHRNYAPRNAGGR